MRVPLRLGALEADFAAEYARAIAHDLQSHAGGIHSVGRHAGAIVGHGQPHLSAGAMQVQSYRPRAAVADRVAHRFLRDPIQ